MAPFTPHLSLFLSPRVIWTKVPLHTYNHSILIKILVGNFYYSLQIWKWRYLIIRSLVWTMKPDIETRERELWSNRFYVHQVSCPRHEKFKTRSSTGSPRKAFYFTISSYHDMPQWSIAKSSHLLLRRNVYLILFCNFGQSCGKKI